MGGAHELLVCAYARALMIIRAKFTVSKISLCKKICFHQQHSLVKLAKIPRIWYSFMYSICRYNILAIENKVESVYYERIARGVCGAGGDVHSPSPVQSVEALDLKSVKNGYSSVHLLITPIHVWCYLSVTSISGYKI